MKKLNLKDEKAWNEWVKNNTDSYGKCCIDVARRVMEILQENETPLIDDAGINNPSGIICKADKDIKAGGITGYMAGCVASMVSKCHVRGEEFRKIWNKENQIRDEGEKANKGKGVLNPAILTTGK